MYNPPAFHVDENEAWRVVHHAGAGLFVRQSARALQSVFAPVLVDETRTVLRSHVARANPWWRVADDDSLDVLVVFLAASAYVSPSLYPSRARDPDVVPTWNYAAVEVRGTLRVVDDLEWKNAQVRALTAHFEEPRSPQWRVDDLDEDFLARQLRAIVGLEIAVTSIEGKEKLSQNRPDEDRRHVRAAFLEGTLLEQNTSQWMRENDPS